jgi:hypothetical protein
MITWRYQYCQVCLVLFTLALYEVSPVNGGAYLPTVGPTPLRFEKPMAPAKAFSWIPVVKQPVNMVTTNPISLTYSNSTNNNSISTPVVIKANSSYPSLPENYSANSAPPTQSASNLLVVSPEMLVDYFKSNSDATNQTNVHVLAPVSFTPPPSALIPSSQAIYISQ